jgi:hypothetical protein
VEVGYTLGLLLPVIKPLNSKKKKYSEDKDANNFQLYDGR